MTMMDMTCAPRLALTPRDSAHPDGTGFDVRHAGRRLAAALIGPLVLLGTRAVEDVDDLDGGDIPGPVLQNPHMVDEDGRALGARLGRP